MNQNKLILPLIFLVMFAIAFILIEPFITKPKVKEEFYTITKEKVEEEETIGKTNSNDLIVMFKTKDRDDYRVSYKRWKITQLWKEEPLIESIEKKERNNFKEIHTK